MAPIFNSFGVFISSSPPDLARPAAHESLFYISVVGVFYTEQATNTAGERA
jgi:hypothetical protein